jgi:hypothetical protein
MTCIWHEMEFDLTLRWGRSGGEMGGRSFDERDFVTYKSVNSVN